MIHDVKWYYIDEIIDKKEKLKDNRSVSSRIEKKKIVSLRQYVDEMLLIEHNGGGFYGWILPYASTS